MGDISIIARRLKDGHVQYGWSGNGGYYSTLGIVLEGWYSTPELVEYLFGLGEVAFLWEPYSENGSTTFRTRPTGRPHNLGISEQEIFSRILFVDYGYFYDLNDTWYYVKPGPMCIKVPLSLVGHVMRKTKAKSEYKFFHQIKAEIIRIMVEDLYFSDLEFQKYANEHGFTESEMKEILEKAQTRLKEDWNPLSYEDEKQRLLLKYFDPWVVVEPSDDGDSFGIITLKKKSDPHIETIFWK